MSEYLFGARGSRAEDPSRVGLVQLALPLILEHILFSTVNLLDVLFISRISDHAVNSVSVPGQYLNICQMAFALDECARGLILLYRWKSEKWVSGAERRKKTIAE